MRFFSKNRVLVVLLAVCAGALVFYSSGFWSHGEPPAVGASSNAGVDPRESQAGKANVINGRTAVAGAKSADAASLGRTAAGIFTDHDLTALERFHALMDLAYKGDPDASYLAYRMEETCRIASAMSKDTVLPALWSADMGRALKALKARCRPLFQDAGFQAFASQVEKRNMSMDTFDGLIRPRIKKTFADSGSTAAVSAALAVYRERPDSTTAMLVAETLSQLGIVKYDPRFELEGLAAASPAVQTDLFYTAMMLHGCEAGIPCGPGSERMLRICALGGGCMPGQGLYQYFENSLSPQNWRNVQALLEALQSIQAEGAG